MALIKHASDYATLIGPTRACVWSQVLMRLPWGIVRKFAILE